MKWNYIKDGKLPKDCERVIGICHNSEKPHSLLYRSVTNMFIVEGSDKYQTGDLIEEDRVIAWISFDQIKEDFKENSRIKELFVTTNPEVYHPVYGCITALEE